MHASSHQHLEKNNVNNRNEEQMGKIYTAYTFNENS